MKRTPTIAKISDGNTKLGKVANISLTPIKACGNCDSCKRDCYALKAYRMYPATRAAWNDNLSLARKNPARYFESIRGYLAHHAPRFFRWHVAGDILGQSYLDSMIALAREFPGTRFLCFTKMHHLDFSGLPVNLSVVLSMFPAMPMPGWEGLPIAWMQDGTEFRMRASAIECPGNCESCGMCFNLRKIGRDVVFHKH